MTVEVIRSGALLVALLGLLLPACGGGGSKPGDVGAVDSRDAVTRRDVTSDVTGPSDSAADAPDAVVLDVPRDGVADVLADGTPGVAPDVAPDAPLDVASDAAADVALDVAPDVPADVPRDVPPACESGCCDDAACDDGDPCTVDTCGEAGTCAHAPYTCHDHEDCTVDVCLGDGECAFEPIEGCCPVTSLWWLDFESGLLGMTVGDRARNTRPEENAWDQPIVWVVDLARAHDWQQALYAGNPVSRTYDNERYVSTTATTPDVSLPAGREAFVSFWVWMDVEDEEGYDALTVSLQVVGLPGQGRDGTIRATVPLWTKPAGFPMEEWRSLSLDLSAFAGETVRVVFVFDTRDGSSNRHEGVYLDEIRIGARCEFAACESDADCDDGVACTADTCADGTCAWSYGGRCCLNAIDCHDGDACSADECVAGAAGSACRNFALPVAGCCNVDADCEDGDPCTADRCDVNRCSHLPSGESGCCASDDDCRDDDPCTEGTCDPSSGACAVTNGCECRYDAQCRDDDEVCTRETCLDGLCMREPTLRGGCCEEDVFVDHFDAGGPSASRWTLENTSAGVGWTTWDGPATTSAALYYGDPSVGSYASGATRNAGTATTRDILLPAAVQVALSFDLFLGVESGVDHDTFSCSLLAGGEEFTIFEKGFLTPTGTWQQVAVDLSGFAGQAVRLQFRFDTVDGEGNDGEGIYVDDFALVSSCLARACELDTICHDGFGATFERCVGGVCQYELAAELCETHDQCNDGDVCTTDVCDLGGCVHEGIPGCCAGDQDCDDGGVCTTDACVGTDPPLCQFTRTPGCCEDVADCDDGNPCTEDHCAGFGGFCDNRWIDGCCVANAQCDDDDPCTLDRCAASACAHLWACCENDGDCDDGDDTCTVDRCVGGRCLFALDGQNPACCTPEPVRFDFEDGTAPGFTLGAGSAGDAWRVLSHQNGAVVHGGTYALNFGNASGTTYASPSEGTATTPPLLLPPGQELTLRFWVWAHTEDHHDDLTAYLDAAGARTFLATWHGQTGWLEERVDVSHLAGEEVRLRFEFSSDDNGYAERGVFVDDIVVESTCAPVSCAADGDCFSPAGCIVGDCVAGGCRFERRSDCCDSAEACDDQNPCTSDRCENDVCTHTAIADCCRSAADCGDAVGCAYGACVENRCRPTCDPDCGEECCLFERACDDGDRCTTDRCGDDFACEHVWVCCGSDAECDDGDDLCTTDRCVDQFCQFTFDATNPDCCVSEPFRIGFEDGTLEGFVSSGGAGGDSWHVVSTGGHTGAHAMAYTGPGGTYHAESFGVAVGPPFDLPAGETLTLSFWLWVDTEAGFDAVRVFLVGDATSVELGAYDGERDWFRVEKDVTYLGGSVVRLQFEFASDGSTSNAGVLVDDIVVESSCAPPECRGDGDCATPTGCVEGRCVGGACVFEPRADCCESDAQCTDDDPCTIDRCVQNRCEFPPDPDDPGCCRSDADCDDGAPCTEDRCENGHCARRCPTDCAYGFPYAETFDSATSMGSSCWSTFEATGGGTSGWSFVTGSSDIAGPHLSFGSFDASADGAYVQCVRSPTIDARLATTARLRFDHAGFAWVSGYTVLARVSNDNGASWQDVWSQSVSSSTHGRADVDVLDEVAGSATVRVALCVSYVGGGFFAYMEWEIDGVSLDGDVYVGNAPVWDTAPSGWEAPIGAESRFPLAGHDLDGDPLAFRLGDDAPTFLTIEDAGDGTAELVAAPGVGLEGDYDFHLVLADAWLETRIAASLAVTIPGSAPEIADPGPQTVVVDTVLRVTIEASDADGDPITFQAGGPLPPFASFRDAGSGRAWLTLSPRIADAGAYVVPIVVGDGTRDIPLAIAVDVVFPGDAAPLVEDFEGAAALDELGWQTVSDAGSPDNGWLLLPGEPGGDPDGHSPVVFDVPVVDDFEDALVSPAFDATGLVDVRVRWTNAWRDYEPLTADPPIELALLASADDGETWLPVWTWSETEGDPPPSRLEAPAPALDGAATARIAFRVSGGTSAALLSWSVDDVIVFGAVPAPAFAPPPE